MVSNRLKEYRKKRGMPISELARRTGLSRVTVTNIENNRVIPNLETAISISKVLEKSLDEIFFESNVNHD